MAWAKMTSQMYEYFKIAGERHKGDGIELTHDLEQITFRISNSERASQIKKHYVDGTPIMIDGFYYKIAQLDVSDDYGRLPTSTHTYTYDLFVYPVGREVDDSMKSNENRESLVKVDRKFLNENGKRVIELYKQLAETKRMIHELEK